MKSFLLIFLLTLFDADFVQTRFSAMLAAPEKATGHMRYESPDQLEWTYEGRSAAALPPRMLDYIRQFIAAEDNPADGWRTVAPLPRQLGRLFSEIRIRYEGGVAREVVLVEQSGDRTEIRFSNIRSK